MFLILKFESSYINLNIFSVVFITMRESYVIALLWALGQLCSFYKCWFQYFVSLIFVIFCLYLEIFFLLFKYSKEFKFVLIYLDFRIDFVREIGKIDRNNPNYDRSAQNIPNFGLFWNNPNYLGYLPRIILTFIFLPFNNPFWVYYI